MTTPSPLAPLNELSNQARLVADIPMPDRVQAGVDLLDECRPGWADSIDLTRLDLNSGTDCILGQIYGEYEDGLADIGLSSTWHGHVRAGFAECQEDPEELAAAWRNRIEARRATTGTAA